MSRQRIIFRADGGPTIGYGHISRCMAIAQLLADEWETVLAVHQPDQSLLGLTAGAVESVINLRSTASDQESLKEFLHHVSSEDVVVLDGYTFDTAFESAVRNKALAVVTIDDIPSRHFVADVVINFCGGVKPKSYSKEFHTELCLGLEYLVLRPPFLRKLVEQRTGSTGILLNMGGADPGNHTRVILDDLVNAGFEGGIDVVVGSGYPFKDTLAPLVKKGKNIKLHTGLGAAAMFELMASCSAAILPPSTVALEYLSTGGRVFIRQTAENQQCMNDYLLQIGAAEPYSTFNDGFANRNPLKSKAPRVPDIGRGSLKRVKKLFAELVLGKKLSLRAATSEDMTSSFDLANDPVVRQNSYSQDQIAWEHHVKWFQQKLADSNCVYLIAELAGEFVGQIRFDKAKNDSREFVLSYALTDRWRGKGLGKAILLNGVKEMLRRFQPLKISGFVQEQNSSSIRAFERLGFEKTSTTIYQNSFKFELFFNS